MKMLKKAASIVLASAMVVSLAACGSSNDKGSSADTDTFKIGGIGPTTGDNAIYGTAVKNGIQLAVDEINAAGGINGKQIEYKFEDDQSDAEKSVNAYNTLKDWGMQILMGTVTSGSCTAAPPSLPHRETGNSEKHRQECTAGEPRIPLQFLL